MERKQNISPVLIRAIKAKCLDCSGGEKKEIALCGIVECPLYRFRLGEQARERERMATRATGLIEAGGMA